jgi:proteasome assembly chaperone (PAC2) family protein
MGSEKVTYVSPEKLVFNDPWLVAVWPGMGNVAVNAGVYMLAKMGMHVIAEMDVDDLFDIEQVLVEGGRIQQPRRPQNRFFAWKDPQGNRDLIVFLGESQPPLGKYFFCRQVVGAAREFGAVRVFTFAAMATDMQPHRPSRVFGATTDDATLAELKRQAVEPLDGGSIGGLNGILPAAAAEQHLPGTCLLGEMPHIFSRLPYPKASLAILEVFRKLSGLELDLTELASQARTVDEQLGTVWDRMQRGNRETRPAEEEVETFAPGPPEEEELDPQDKRRIDELFEQAANDRSKAFELKQELDRLGVFKDYEDRFLDLFKAR